MGSPPIVVLGVDAPIFSGLPLFPQLLYPTLASKSPAIPMSHHSVSSPHWSPETKRWAILGVFLLLGGLIYYARSALGWLVIAALLAYLLQPLVNWLDDHNMPRPMAAITALLIAIAIIFVIPAILFPLLLNQFTQMFGDVINASLKSLELFNNWIQGSQMLDLKGFKIDLSGIIQEISKLANVKGGNVYVPTSEDIFTYVQQAIAASAGLIGSLSGFLTSLIARTVSLAFSIFLLLFYTFYITVDGHKLKPWAKSLFKPEYLPEVNELGLRINRVWHAFFRGQLMLSLVIGTMTLIVGLLIGLPSALALAIIAGVMEAVPTIGPILAAIPAVILALTQGSSALHVGNGAFALITIGAYILIQQTENAVIVPRIMGSALELHPIIVLVGVVIGASFAGVLGVFLAAPTLATMKVLLTYAHAKILDIPPFPISFEEEQSMQSRNRITLPERWHFRRQKLALNTQQTHDEE